MSKTSRFFLWVIILGLAFIAGMRLYRAYERYAASQADSAVPTLTFNDVPVRSVPAAVPEKKIYRVWKEQPQEIYLQDTALDPAQEKEQAQATVVSVLNDYRQEPKMQAFVADLRKATGRQDLDMAVLSGTQLSELMTQYPQIQQVVAEYAKDPEFVKILQEIFQNPQFVRSMQVLQGSGTAAQ